MGRMFPLDDNDSINIIHPAFPFSLMVAAMAAIIAIITGLCGFRRKPAHKLDPSEETPSSPPAPVTGTTTLETGETKTEDSEEGIKELPPPPAMRSLRETYSCNNFMQNSASSRKLSLTLSVKHTRHMRSISVSKIKELRDKGKTKAAEQDSVWTKRIILGERCKVSDDHDDDDVVYDGKGNKVTAYHPRTQSSVSMSRSRSLGHPDTTTTTTTTSCLDQEKEKGVTRKDDEDS